MTEQTLYHYYIYLPRDYPMQTSLFVSDAEVFAYKYGCPLLALDNIMTASFYLADQHKSYYLNKSEFVLLLHLKLSFAVSRIVKGLFCKPAAIAGCHSDINSSPSLLGVSSHSDEHQRNQSIWLT